MRIDEDATERERFIAEKFADAEAEDAIDPIYGFEEWRREDEG